MKRLKTVVIAAAITLPGIALAAETKLNCPAGTVQAGGPSSGLEATFCALEGTRTPHGPYISLDKAGRVLAEGQFDNGFRTGTWTIFDGNGTKTAEIQFEKGDFHGRKVSFHKNGRKATEEQYVMGRREGDLRRFDATGEVVAVEKFRGNVRVQ